MVLRYALILLGAITACFAAGWITGLATGPASAVASSSVDAEPQSPGATAPAEDPTFSTKIQPFLKKYCVECHTGDKPKGGLTLDAYQSEAHARKDRKNWGAVQHVTRLGRHAAGEEAAADEGGARVRHQLDREHAHEGRLQSVRGERSRPRDHPAAQPGRVQQHHPRSVRRGLQARRRLPRRRRRLRLRQHRRRALVPADAARKVHDRGRQGARLPRSRSPRQPRAGQADASGRRTSSPSRAMREDRDGRRIDRSSSSPKGPAFLREVTTSPPRASTPSASAAGARRSATSSRRSSIRVDGKDVKTFTVEAAAGQAADLRGEGEVHGRREARRGRVHRTPSRTRRPRSSASSASTLIEIEGPFNAVAAAGTGIGQDAPDRPPEGRGRRPRRGREGADELRPTARTADRSSPTKSRGS